MDLAQSDDPAARLAAAENLCPCHVRRRVDDVWQALYRMMEDDDVRVRRAAWHTLEDGGVPQDPAIEPIFRRAVAQLGQVDDRFTRTLIQTFAVPYLRELDELDVQRASPATMPHRRRGKCDFCGRAEQAVRLNFDTELRDSAGRTRFALICKDCE